MTSAALRERYFANGFAEAVRFGRLDEAQWVDLVDCLHLLCEEWRDQDCVDKDIAQDLYVLDDIVRWQAERLTGDEATVLADRATQLQDLVLRVYDGRWVS